MCNWIIIFRQIWQRKSLSKWVQNDYAIRVTNLNLTMIQDMWVASYYKEQDFQNCRLQMAVCWHCKEIAPPNFPLSVANYLQALLQQMKPPIWHHNQCYCNCHIKNAPNHLQDQKVPINHAKIWLIHHKCKAKKNLTSSYKAKEIRKTFQQTQQSKINTKKQNDQMKKVVKEATLS